MRQFDREVNGVAMAAEAPRRASSDAPKKRPFPAQQPLLSAFDQPPVNEAERQCDQRSALNVRLLRPARTGRGVGGASFWFGLVWSFSFFPPQKTSTNLRKESAIQNRTSDRMVVGGVQILLECARFSFPRPPQNIN